MDAAAARTTAEASAIADSMASDADADVGRSRGAHRLGPVVDQIVDHLGRESRVRGGASSGVADPDLENVLELGGSRLEPTAR